MGLLVMCIIFIKVFCIWDIENIKEENKFSFYKINENRKKFRIEFVFYGGMRKEEDFGIVF